jgi:hypothetical protein
VILHIDRGFVNQANSITASADELIRDIHARRFPIGNATIRWNSGRQSFLPPTFTYKNNPLSRVSSRAQCCLLCSISFQDIYGAQALANSPTVDNELWEGRPSIHRFSHVAIIQSAETSVDEMRASLSLNIPVIVDGYFHTEGNLAFDSRSLFMMGKRPGQQVQVQSMQIIQFEHHTLNDSQLRRSFYKSFPAES